MIYVKNDSRDPYFNLAAEEYCLRNFDEDIISLWINDASVIIGKNQNAYAELNFDYIREHGIKVVRRLTGGGAVFHDKGNINFTFIQKMKNNAINFEHFTRPVISALRSLGLDAELKGRNDIMINDCKISGNAQCNYKVFEDEKGKFTEKTLHHGTLLFDVNINDLAASLNVNEEKIKSKSVKSIRNRVGNISEFLEEKMSVEEFFSYLEKFLTEEVRETVTFTETQREEIEKLKSEKYSNPKYVFGNNIKYSFENKKYLNCGLIEFNFNVKNNIISDFKVMGDFFGVSDISEFEGIVNGTIHGHEEIEKLIEKTDVTEYIMNAEKSDLVKMFF